MTAQMDRQQPPGSGYYVVQGHSKSPILVPFESSCDFLLAINTNLPHILHRLQVTADWVKFSLATGECLTSTPSLGVIPAKLHSGRYISVAETIHVPSTTFM